MKELKPYIVEFFEHNVMKSKVYPFDYIVRGENY